MHTYREILFFLLRSPYEFVVPDSLMIHDPQMAFLIMPEAIGGGIYAPCEQDQNVCERRYWKDPRYIQRRNHDDDQQSVYAHPQFFHDKPPNLPPRPIPDLSHFITYRILPQESNRSGGRFHDFGMDFLKALCYAIVR